MKKLLALVLILCMACALCGCLEDTDPKTTIGDNSTVSVSDLNGANASDDQPKEEVKMATVGQNVSSEKWKISLLSAKLYDKIEAKYHTDEPESGNKFLVLFFEVENISNEDDRFINWHFESYIDGYSSEQASILNDPDGVGDLHGDVASGKKLKGQICYEVPEGWQEVEVHYKEDSWSSNPVKLKFVVTPDKVAQ